jgi:hypothetical protein
LGALIKLEGNMNTQITRPKKLNNGVSVWIAVFTFVAMAVELR